MPPATYLELALLLPPLLAAQPNTPPQAEPTEAPHTSDIARAYPTQQGRLRHDVSAYLGSLLGTVLYHEGMRAEDLDFDRFIHTFATRLALQGQKVPEPDQNEIDTRTAMEAIHAKMEQRKQAIAEKNAERGRRFLKENAKKPGIVTTPSGLQYRIDKQGSGPIANEEDDIDIVYEIKYTIHTLDGVLVDNPQEETNKIWNRSNLDGLDEILDSLPAGSKWTLYIPSELGFGDAPMDIDHPFPGQYTPITFDRNRIRQAGIPGNSVLIMTVEMMARKDRITEKLADYFPGGNSPFPVNRWNNSPPFEINSLCFSLSNLYQKTEESGPFIRPPAAESVQRSVFSQRIAALFADKAIWDGFTLTDIDLPTFRNSLQAALRTPESMDTLEKKYSCSMPTINRNIDTRNRQEAAAEWLRGKQLLDDIYTNDRLKRRVHIISQKENIGIPSLTVEKGNQSWETPKGDDPDSLPPFNYLVKYRITDIDGRILEDRTHETQQIFSGDCELIPSLCETLQNESIGFKGIFYIPPAAGFGEERTLSNDNIPIPGNSVLIVELEFLGIETNPGELSE